MKIMLTPSNFPLPIYLLKTRLVNLTTGLNIEETAAQIKRPPFCNKAMGHPGTPEAGEEIPPHRSEQ